MLKENPKVGQKVRLIEDDYAITTIGNEYEIKGVDSDNGNPWFVDDDKEIVYIDSASFNCYELVGEQKPRATIGITGIEIDGEFYVEEPTQIKLHLVAMAHPNDLLGILDELHNDIAKLLRDKYQL